MNRSVAGAVFGDICGSIYEFNNLKTTDVNSIKLYDERGHFTDDSLMTLIIAEGIKKAKAEGNINNAKKHISDLVDKIARNHMDCGFGGRFYKWVLSDNKNPYNSFGNGSAMRIGYVIDAANSIEEGKEMSRIVTEITHNHPEGLKGAEAIAVCGIMAKQRKTKEEIKMHMIDNYYKLDFTIDEIRPFYSFDETCQGSVPKAIELFLESTSFENAIQLAISLGGDCDTTACMVGSIAGQYYEIPDKVNKYNLEKLSDDLKNIYTNL